MPTLSTLYASEMRTFEDYQRKIESALRSVINSRKSRGPVYTIKSRVKDFNSLERNWLKDGPRATSVVDRKYVRDVPELFQHVHDLIGARIVFLFPSDVREVKQHFEETAASHGIELLEKDWDEMKWGPWWEDDEGEVIIPPTGKVRDSGYTSVHRDIRLTEAGVFAGFQCELQIRTLLEEAWAEPNHFLVYKKRQSPETKTHFRILKAQLNAADTYLQTIANRSLRDRQLQETRHNIQVSKSYKWNCTGLQGDLADEFAEAYQLREQEQHRDALRLHDRMLQSLPKTNSELCGPVLLEKALDTLMAGGSGYLERATRIYSAPLMQTSPDLDFWASFRLSYILHEQHAHREAVRRCEHALNILKRKFKGEIPCYDCAGLEADVLTWRAVLLWRLAAQYEEEGKLAAFESRRKMAKTSVQLALKLLPKDDAAVRDIRNRALNNLAFYHIQSSRPSLETARALLADMTGLPKDRTAEPSVPMIYIMETEAELEFAMSRSRSNTAADRVKHLEEAVKQMRAAKKMLNSISLLHAVPRTLGDVIEKNLAQFDDALTNAKAAIDHGDDQHS